MNTSRLRRFLSLDGAASESLGTAIAVAVVVTGITILAVQWDPTPPPPLQDEDVDFTATGRAGSDQLFLEHRAGRAFPTEELFLQVDVNGNSVYSGPGPVAGVWGPGGRFGLTLTEALERGDRVDVRIIERQGAIGDVLASTSTRIPGGDDDIPPPRITHRWPGDIAVLIVHPTDHVQVDALVEHELGRVALKRVEARLPGISPPTRLVDDGSRFDSVAGDSVFSWNFNVPVDALPGLYPVLIVAEDFFGGRDQHISWVEIRVISRVDSFAVFNPPDVLKRLQFPPVARFTASCAGFTCAFDGHSSFDPDGVVQVWEWSFGNGMTGTGADTTHTYEANGTYPVKLTVTDNTNREADITLLIPVTGLPPGNAAPTALFTWSCSGLTCTFDGSPSSDSDGVVTDWLWVFPGGNVTGSTASFTFPTTGDYPVMLIVTDDDGATGLRSLVVGVAAPLAANLPPTAAFDVTCVINICAFDASASTDPEGSVLQYVWRFGDGASSLGGPLAAHVYTQSGQYTIVLVVTDAAGNSATTTRIVDITAPNAPPIADFVSSCTGLTCDFDARRSRDADGTVTAHAWSFGDGTTGTGATTSHTFSAPGTYLITLQIVDDDGQTGLATGFVVVAALPAGNIPPVASWTFVCTGLACTFDGTGSSDLDGTITSYAWTFGDGTTGTGSALSHTFPAPGTYAVRLDVTDDDGALSSRGALLTVTVATLPNRAPVANYVVACTGLTCTFDSSASFDPDDEPVTRVWVMGDGTIITGPTAITHTFPAPGTYFVTLTVTDPHGASGTAHGDLTVTAGAPPFPVLVYDCSGLACAFDARRSFDPDGTIVSYAWDFGDGTAGTGSTIDHSYLLPGTYTVRLTVTDDDGVTATVYALVTVTAPGVANLAPTASWTFTCSGFVCSFDGSPSSDPDGTLTTYAWDFGDGSTALGPSASHTFLAAGTYRVRLTVTDDDGATGTRAADLTVIGPGSPLNQAPTAVVHVVCDGLTCAFDGSASSDPEGKTLTYAWDLGDGTRFSDTVAFTHVFAAPGTYFVTLVVTDPLGATGSARGDVLVTLGAPSTALLVFGCSGLTCSFDGLRSFDPDGTITAYLWDFGDGSSATGGTTSHTFLAPGTYTVRLTVTDDAGLTTWTTALVTVTAPPPGNVPPTASWTFTCQGLVCQFDGGPSTDSDGTITTYAWDFGDGASGTGATTAHTFPASGTFTVTLTVTDDDGATSSRGADLTVKAVSPPSNQAPTAAYTVTCTDLTCTFDASGSFDPEGGALTFAWNLGDGTILTGATNVVHTFPAPGMFFVTLTVTDPLGATGSAHGDLTVTVGEPPVALAVVTCAGLACTFDALRSYDPDGTITNYAWDFGDGSSGTGAVTTHTYPAPGTYTVRLVVTDDSGATTAILLTVTVTGTPVGNLAPLASWTYTCTGLACTFDGTGSTDADGTIVAYLWDFGDGTASTGSVSTHTFAAPGVYHITLTVTDDDGAAGNHGATLELTGPGTPTNQAPTAAFTVTCTDLACAFDASTSSDPEGGALTFTWDFGDGTRITGPASLSHTFPAAGIYFVTLTVTDPEGATGQATGDLTVRVGLPPVALLVYDCAGLMCSFDGSRSYDPDGTIVSYAWDFGDGTTASGADVDHAFTAPGTYTVRLTVTDNNGSVTHVVVLVTVAALPVGNLAPTASWTYACTGFSCTFDGTASSDIDGTIVAYLWTFGDGSTATGATPAHVYAAAGAFSVTLTVTDDDGAIASHGATLHIEGPATPTNQAPTAAFTVTCTDLACAFDGSSSSDPEGGALTYTWDFGDGTRITGPASLSHTFPTSGTYFVTLIVTDPLGATGQATGDLVVTAGEPPVALAVVDCEALACTFDARRSFDPDGTIVSYAWDFGDGTTGAGPLTTHTYATPGTYTVRLTVTDNDGSVTHLLFTVTVTAPPLGNLPPTASWTFTCAALACTFDGTGSSDLDGTIVTYTWTFGDGSATLGATPVHTYATPGTYTVVLTVTDDSGATASHAATIIVTDAGTPGNLPPTATYTVTCTDLACTFDGSGSSDPEGGALTYTWNFGDGTRITGPASLSHTFPAAGTYFVTLTVTDPAGATSTATGDLAVTVGLPPVGLITYQCADLVCDFDARRSFDPDGTIVSYAWDFGDGSSASGDTAGHVFGAAGTYTVRLAVTDNDGVTTYTFVTVTVTAPPLGNTAPVASWTFTCTGLVCVFDGTGSSDIDGVITTYAWDFGDGTTATGATVPHAYAASGTYTVRLTVTDDDGATGSRGTELVVTGGGLLNLAPTASYTVSCTDLACTFDGTASLDPEGGALTYTWNFGDGTRIDGPAVVTHTFPGAGTYFVTLTVTDPLSATGSAHGDLTVTIGLPPVPLVSFECSDLACTFDARRSFDPDGTIVSYTWNFGDGTTATGPLTTHTFLAPGTYTVRLSVTDNDGVTSHRVVLVTVTVGPIDNVPPVASWHFSCTGLTCAFDGTPSSDVDGSVVWYVWDFGDGTTATTATASHTFPAPGTYTVRLTVTDDDGATSSRGADLRLEGDVDPTNLSPTAVVTVTCTDLTCTFDGSASFDPEGGALIYVWNFGDGTRLTGASVETHTFAASGTYFVTLTVIDPLGAWGVAQGDAVVVRSTSPPVARFDHTCVALACSFDGSGSFDADGPIVLYLWDFNDGTTATGPLATHAFTAAGTYNVTLTVTDTDGNTATRSHLVTATAPDPLNAPPTAAFTFTCTGLMCAFDASGSSDSDGTILLYTWNFGAHAPLGNGSFLVHTFPASGTYPVLLTVTDNDGATATRVVDIVVTAPPGPENGAPTARFTVTCTGLVCAFDGAASTDPDGDPLTYVWRFGDGSTGTGVAPSHTFAAAGTYQVTLTVTDPLGATGSTSHPVTATATGSNERPTAAFTIDCTALTCLFDARLSTDPDGTIVSYAWTFGDGTTGVGPTPTHAYASAGTYTVRLTVTDNDGATATRVIDVVVTAPQGPGNGAPTARFTVTCTGLVCAFNGAASTDPDGDPLTYTWQFDDGSTGTGVAPSHTFAAAGTYQVTLTVTDPLGATGSTSQPVTATATGSNERPTAAFTIDCTALTCLFDARLSTDPDGTIVSYAWTFGDGTTGVGPTPTHAYASAGTYTVRLTVTDNDGATATRVIDVVVTAPQGPGNGAPTARFTVTCTGLVCAFNGAASTDPDGDPLTYTWHFDDGSTGTGVAPSHTFAAAGTYQVTLTVRDPLGATGSTSQPVTATAPGSNEPPTAAFTVSCSALVCLFDARLATDPDGTIVSYAWTFGDGTAGVGLTPTHVYANAGTYVVRLTVTDNHGATDTRTIPVRVQGGGVGNLDPIANWTFTCTGLLCAFDGSPSVDPDGTIVSYLWDFGDGTTATGATPPHVYLAPGTYVVTLTVTDDYGSTASLARSITVTGGGDPQNGAPTARFTWDCTFLACVFDGLTSSDPESEALTYAWTFGDGSSSSGSATPSHTYSAYTTRFVTLTVTDPHGATGSVTHAVTTVPPPNDPPVSLFVFDCNGLTCDFDARRAYDPDGTVIWFAWTFGDGGTATGVQPSHTFGGPGSYWVTLTVTDDDGATHASTAAVVVTTDIPNNIPPVSRWTFSCSGLLCSFDGTGSFDLDGSVVSYAWHFGDGSAIVASAAPNHNFAAPGIYAVRLVVTDDDGATGSHGALIEVTAREPPNRAPSSVYTVTCLALTCSFNGTASSDPDGDALTYTWRFGDGTVDVTGPLVTHTFPAPGVYFVTLTVTDPFGATGTSRGDLFVSDVVPPTFPGGTTCPHTIGYWRNHAESWPLVAFSLGAATYTQAELLVILNTPPQGDKVLQMARQLIATKLNLFVGGPTAPIVSVVEEADDLLALFPGKLPYGIETGDIATRAEELKTELDDINNGHGVTCDEAPPDDDDDFTILPGGGVTPLADRNATVTVIGTAITYGAGGPTIPVRVDYTENGGASFIPLFGDAPVTGGESTTFPNVTAGSIVGVRGRADYQDFHASYVSFVGDPHVLVLQDGDSVPDIPAFDGQTSIEDFLAPYIQAGEVWLAANQAIILFEFNPSVNSNAADWQDLVVILTFPDE